MNINILRDELKRYGIELIDPKLPFKSLPAPLNLNAILYIINHHMASPAAGIETIHGWHLGNGWAGIGYNFWIDFAGRVFIGRGFRHGAHARGYNAVSIGIGFQGDFRQPMMTDVQVRTGGILNGILLKAFGLPQTAAIGHKDVLATACPGPYFRWPDLRQVIASYLDQDYIEVEGGEESMFTRVMRQGMQGIDIEQLQVFLKKQGLYKGAIDGKFGPLTLAAVRAFQAARKLVVDGIAGPLTQARINEILLAEQADNTDYKAKLVEAKALAGDFAKKIQAL